MMCSVEMNKLTPSFHPAMGMIPTTDTVMMTMVSVASSPVMMFIVAITRIGNARQRPTAIPVTADVASIWRLETNQIILKKGCKCHIYRSYLLWIKI